MQANLSKPAQISLISVTKDHCEMEKQRIKKKKKKHLGRKEKQMSGKFLYSHANIPYFY